MTDETGLILQAFRNVIDSWRQVNSGQMQKRAFDDYGLFGDDYGPKPASVVPVPVPTAPPLAVSGRPSISDRLLDILATAGLAAASTVGLSRLSAKARRAGGFRSLVRNAIRNYLGTNQPPAGASQAPASSANPASPAKPADKS